MDAADTAPAAPTGKGSATVAVVGGGITGAAAAHELTQRGIAVTLLERDGRTGGRLARSAFAGLDDVDESADAFRARVPDAVALAVEVGLGDDLVHPEPVGAAVWHERLHPIPAGLVLGVPGSPWAMARSGLLSPRAKLRAALEPLRPRSATDHDNLGRYVRERFGDEVHERLVDALVGSIYAADTDRFPLREVPQLAALAEHRSLLLAARSAARKAATASGGTGTATGGASAVFAAPRRGVGALADATIERATAGGARVRLGVDPTIERAGDGWRIDGEPYDAVVLATPAPAAAPLLTGVVEPADDGVVGQLASQGHSDVIMVTMHVGAAEWPDTLGGTSGYLVPKPVQRSVTAASFASQKWAHWRPPAGGEVLRVSLGREGAPALHLTDDEVVERVLDDLGLHLGTRFSPIDVRITRWPGAFAQYRPHHRRWVDAVRTALPAGLFVAGASYDGMGVPACVRSGRTIAERVADHVNALAK